MSPDADIPVTVGLHHHGEDPEVRLLLYIHVDINIFQGYSVFAPP